MMIECHTTKPQSFYKYICLDTTSLFRDHRGSFTFLPLRLKEKSLLRLMQLVFLPSLLLSQKSETCFWIGIYIWGFCTLNMFYLPSNGKWDFTIWFQRYCIGILAKLLGNQVVRWLVKKLSFHVLYVLIQRQSMLEALQFQ